MYFLPLAKVSYSKVHYLFLLVREKVKEDNSCVKRETSEFDCATQGLYFIYSWERELFQKTRKPMLLLFFTKKSKSKNLRVNKMKINFFGAFSLISVNLWPKYSLRGRLIWVLFIKKCERRGFGRKWKWCASMVYEWMGGVFHRVA